MSDPWASLTGKDGKGKGGQSAKAAKQISTRLNRIHRDTWVEPFLGVGNVYRATKPSKREILNDLDCKRTRETRRRFCGLKGKEKCARLRAARLTCGKDYKGFLSRYDKKGTLIYLDPPYHDRTRNQTYGKTGLDFNRFVLSVRGIKNACVAISYSNNPEFKREFCGSKGGYRCHSIKKSIFRDHYTEILAIKKARC